MMLTETQIITIAEQYYNRKLRLQVELPYVEGEDNTELNNATTLMYDLQMFLWLGVSMSQINQRLTRLFGDSPDTAVTTYTTYNRL